MERDSTSFRLLTGSFKERRYACKDIAKQVIDTLPDEASMDDITHALYIKAKFEKGVREIHDARALFMMRLKKRLLKWVKQPGPHPRWPT